MLGAQTAQSVRTEPNAVCATQAHTAGVLRGTHSVQTVLGAETLHPRIAVRLVAWAISCVGVEYDSTANPIAASFRVVDVLADRIPCAPCKGMQIRACTYPACMPPQSSTPDWILMRSRKPK